MSNDKSNDDANLEHALRLLQTGGATLEQAAAQFGVEPAALQARLSAPAPVAPHPGKKKPPSRFEVCFWLPD
jgi:hypothetical protein